MAFDINNILWTKQQGFSSNNPSLNKDVIKKKKIIIPKFDLSLAKDLWTTWPIWQMQQWQTLPTPQIWWQNQVLPTKNVLSPQQMTNLNKSKVIQQKPTIWQSISNSILPTANANQEQTYNDRDLQYLKKLKTMWISKEDAIKLVDEKKASLIQQPTPTVEKPEASFKTSLWWWMVSEVPNVLWNMSKVGSYVWYGLNKTVWWVTSWFWLFDNSVSNFFNKNAEQDIQSGIKAQQKWQELKTKTLWLANIDPNSAWANIWGMITDIWASTLIPWWIASKGLSKISWVSKIAGALPKTSSFIKTGVQWAELWATYDIASKWKVTPESVILWAWGNIALKWAWKILWTTWKYLSKSLPASLQLKWLLNPQKLEYVNNTLIKEWQKSPEDVAKWMLDRNLKGSKEEIITKLETRAKESMKAVDDTLKTIDDTVWKWFRNKQANIWAWKVADDFEWSLSPELKVKADRMRELSNKPNLTLQEQQEIKRALDERYSIYKLSTEVRENKMAQDLDFLRKWIKNNIEDTAEQYWAWNIRMLNNETAVSKALSQWIQKKSNAETIREIVSPFSWQILGWVIWWTAWWPFKWDDYISKTWNIIFWAMVWKWLNSTYLKTNLASVLNKLSKQEMWALEKYYKTWWKENVKFMSDFFNKVKWKLTLPEAWKSSFIEPTKKTIITPYWNI